MCKYIEIHIEIRIPAIETAVTRCPVTGLWIYDYMVEPSDADNDEDIEDCNCLNCHQRAMLPGAP